MRYPRRLRPVAFGLGGVAASVALAACGSSNKSSTTAATTGGASTAAASDPTAAGVAYAKQQIAAATAVPKFTLNALRLTCPRSRARSSSTSR